MVLDPDGGTDWQLPFCVVLTCRDGKIASHRTSAEFSKTRVLVMPVEEFAVVMPTILKRQGFGGSYYDREFKGKRIRPDRRQDLST